MYRGSTATPVRRARSPCTMAGISFRRHASSSTPPTRSRNRGVQVRGALGEDDGLDLRFFLGRSACAADRVRFCIIARLRAWAAPSRVATRQLEASSSVKSEIEDWGGGNRVEPRRSATCRSVCWPAAFVRLVTRRVVIFKDAELGCLRIMPAEGRRQLR